MLTPLGGIPLIAQSAGDPRHFKIYNASVFSKMFYHNVPFYPHSSNIVVMIAPPDRQIVMAAELARAASCVLVPFGLGTS